MMVLRFIVSKEAARTVFGATSGPAVRQTRELISPRQLTGQDFARNQDSEVIAVMETIRCISRTQAKRNRVALGVLAGSRNRARGATG
jgi:hypothetical protein